MTEYAVESVEDLAQVIGGGTATVLTRRAAARALASGVVRLAADVRAEALRPFEELFGGGPDTPCRTMWLTPAATFDQIEAVVVPMEDLRAAFDKVRDG